MCVQWNFLLGKNSTDTGVSSHKYNLMLNIHINAKVNFDNKANLLHEAIGEIILPQESNEGYTPDRPVEVILKEEDLINDPTYYTSDYTDTITSRYFSFNSKTYGLDGDNYRKLRFLTESIYKIRSVNSVLSKTTIETLIFEWVKLKFLKKVDVALIEFLDVQSKELVKHNEIWTPLFLYVESSFTIGKIEIVPTDSKIWDTWIENTLEHWPNQKEDLRKLFKGKQKQYQGYAASIFRIEAEFERAIELAISETNKSLDCLRIFAPHNLFINKTSNCKILGCETIETVENFFIHENKLIASCERVLGKSSKTWMIRNDLIDMMKKSGLNNLSSLVLNENQSDFQKSILDTIFLFSKSCIVNQTTDKLIYIFVSIESLLLKDSGEPIQQNISERIAIFLGESLPEKKEIIFLVKEAYKIRSSFFHHGLDIESEETLENFLKIINTFFLKLIHINTHYKSKTDFINNLEDQKLS